MRDLHPAPQAGLGRLVLLRLGFVLTLSLTLSAPASAVTMDWVLVGNADNAPDPDANTEKCGTTRDQPCGAVADTYRIGRYEVTNAQYVEFLNAKAASDPLGLYNTSMAGTFGGITRSGSSGSYSYSTVAGRENKPVVHVSFYDSLRFANWMNNGQGSGDTETGAYTLLGGTATPSNGTTVTRNASATIFLTSEDEWYKAAYYDAVSTSYNPYPFADGFNDAVCESPAGTTSHSANCASAVGNTTDVGAYTTSPSASGTFDQGGNVYEWNEAIISGSFRGLRGASWVNNADSLAASDRDFFTPDPSNEFTIVGFRVASVPEPATGLLVMGGTLGLAVWRRRGVYSLDLWLSFPRPDPAHAASPGGCSRSSARAGCERPVSQALSIG